MVVHIKMVHSLVGVPPSDKATLSRRAVHVRMQALIAVRIYRRSCSCLGCCSCKDRRVHVGSGNLKEEREALKFVPKGRPGRQN